MRSLLAILLLSAALSADDWKYAKSADGAIAYTRAVAASSFKEYKVETEIEATVERDYILEFLRKADRGIMRGFQGLTGKK